MFVFLSPDQIVTPGPPHQTSALLALMRPVWPLRFYMIGSTYYELLWNLTRDGPLSSGRSYYYLFELYVFPKADFAAFGLPLSRDAGDV